MVLLRKISGPIRINDHDNTNNVTKGFTKSYGGTVELSYGDRA